MAAVSFGAINYLFLPIGASSYRDKGDLKFVELNETISSNFTSQTFKYY
jgi:hypothetical protein